MCECFNFGQAHIPVLNIFRYLVLLNNFLWHHYCQGQSPVTAQRRVNRSQTCPTSRSHEALQSISVRGAVGLSGATRTRSLTHVRLKHINTCALWKPSQSDADVTLLLLCAFSALGLSVSRRVLPPFHPWFLLFYPET